LLKKLIGDRLLEFLRDVDGESEVRAELLSKLESVGHKSSKIL